MDSAPWSVATAARMRSRRGWKMTALLSELCDLPAEAMFDGEIVAFADGRPHFPLVCDRLLHRDGTIPLTYVIFDVLALDGESTMALAHRERRATSRRPQARERPVVRRGDVRGRRGPLRCRLRARPRGHRRQTAGQFYRPGDRAWIKTKNRAYWRYGEELESTRRSLDRRTRLC
jgi:hypothetical protein